MEGARHRRRPDPAAQDQAAHPTPDAARQNAQELSKNPVDGFSAELLDDNDIFKWEVLIIGPPDTLFEGGLFKAHLYFTKEYPYHPPKMKYR